MPIVLVPTDGSPNALQALRHAALQQRANPSLRLHLLNVQPRLHHHAGRFLSRADRSAWYQARAEAALAPAKALLRQRGTPFQAEWCMGRRAEQICVAAQRLQAHHIVLGAARKHPLARLLQDSVTQQVLLGTPVPVEVVAGRSVSLLERWGVPASVGLGLGSVLWMALD